jgi:LPS-assembly lipoprotein
MFRHLARYTLLLALTCLLGACGFQLRGTGASSAALPDTWKSMYLATGNPNSEFSQAVRTVFTTDGIEWTTDRAAANYTLVLGPERFNQTNLSLNAEARVSQLELTLQTNFSVVARDGSEVMAQETAQVLQQMDYDPRNAMGKGDEIRIHKNEMRTELARQIIRRIGFFAISSP